MKYAFLFLVLLAFLVIEGCNESVPDNEKSAQHSLDTGSHRTTVTKIRLMKDTMDGNEAKASNGLMTLRVKGLYQPFSGYWSMGIKLRPLRDITVSKVTWYSFTGKNIRLRDYEKIFYPPAGQFRGLVEREVNISFIQPAASMLVIFYDQRGDVLSKFEITHIVDHMIGIGMLPAASREVYENAQ